MPFTMGDAEKLKYFNSHSKVNNSELGNALKSSKSVNDVATFVAKVGEELFPIFYAVLKGTITKPFKANAKNNVQRIAQKITEIADEKKLPISEAWQHLTDIVRLQVFCSTPAEVKSFFRDVLMKNPSIY